jgi:RHS repeat-associated protein
MQASEGTTTASAHLAFCDANGNITDYIAIYPDGSGETNGTVVARYQYDPYGNLIEQNGPKADTLRFRFSSKYLESELETATSDGLYYYGYRFYNPTLGRWMSRDPLGEFAEFNIHAFLANNPIGACDYLGLIDHPERFFEVLNKLKDCKASNPEAYNWDAAIEYLLKTAYGKKWKKELVRIADALNRELDLEIRDPSKYEKVRDARTKLYPEGVPFDTEGIMYVDLSKMAHSLKVWVDDLVEVG